MKKFTSLFALLSCLCVVSAQADVTIYINATNISNNPRLHWWGIDGAPEWDNDPYLTNTEVFQRETVNGINFYKKTFTGNVSILFRDNSGQTQNIENLSASSYYYTYNGGTDGLFIVGYDNGNPVYRQPYYAAIVSLGITGPFNNWSTTTDKFSYVNGVWTYILEPKDANNIAFKIIPNGYWAGFTGNTIQPSDWFQSDKDGNIVLMHSSLQKSEYKLTATWNQSWDAVSGWTLTAEGVNADQYTIGSTTYTIGETNTVDLSNDQPFSTATSFTATSATYSRNTGNNHWGTLCLPFEINNVPSGVTFYNLTSVSSEAMTFTPINGSIAAGTPVAFKLTEPGTLLINESNVPVVADPTTSGITGWTMNGTFQQKTLDGIYYIYNDKYYNGSDITLKPYRAWFSGSGSGAPLRIEEEDTEGLQFVEQEDGTVKAYYDLQGRKLESARKGLAIENGKIIMVK